MSADGSVEVKVSADGADEAAEDLSDESAATVGGPGGRQRDEGILGRSLKGGAILAAITLLVELLGPIADYISGTLEVLQAFLAPLSLMLMRLLMPFLRFMIRLLPAWYDFVTNGMDTIERISGLIGSLLNTAAMIITTYWSAVGALLGGLLGFFRSPVTSIKSALSSAESHLSSLPRDIWNFVSRLPKLLGTVIASKVPGVDVSESGRDLSDRITSRENPAFAAGQDVGNFIVELNGGLDAFVDRIERDANIDLP